jgi:hypothetical protein
LSPIKRARAPRKHHLALPRRVASKKRSAGITAYDRAAQAAFPCAPEAYPGLLRGMADLLGGRAAVRTILDWRRGRRKAPVWAMDVLQEALRDRVRRETQSIEELEKKRLFDLPLHSTGNYKSFAVVSGSLQESHTCCYRPSMPLACLRLPKNHILFSANGLRLSRTGTRHFLEQSPSRSMKRAQ